MANNGTIIGVSDVAKTFTTAGNRCVQALHGINIEVTAGEFLAIVGPTGCGKTTLLRIMSGLDTPDGGSVQVFAENDRHRPSAGFMFQQHALFPWMTVEKNVLFALSAAGWDKHAASERCSECLHLVGLEQSAKSFPYELSGGMQRRTALARTIAPRPKIVLMDEPFSALDIATARELYDQMLDMYRRFDMTVVLVSHNIEEAIFLASRVLVMATPPGRVVEEVNVDLPYPRDRLSEPFIRKMLDVREFFEKESLGSRK